MKRLYNIIVTLAAFTTIAFVALDFCGKISLAQQPADENDINELFDSLSEAEKKKVIEIIKIMKE